MKHAVSSTPKLGVQSGFYILWVERDWCLDLLSFLSMGLFLTSHISAGGICPPFISNFRAGWLSWCDPGSMVIRQEGGCPVHPSFGLGLSCPYGACSQLFIYPEVGSSFIQTGGSFFASRYPEFGTVQSLVACVNSLQVLETKPPF